MNMIVAVCLEQCLPFSWNPSSIKWRKVCVKWKNNQRVSYGGRHILSLVCFTLVRRYEFYYTDCNPFQCLYSAGKTQPPHEHRDQTEEVCECAGNIQTIQNGEFNSTLQSCPHCPLCLLQRSIILRLCSLNINWAPKTVWMNAHTHTHTHSFQRSRQVRSFIFLATKSIAHTRESDDDSLYNLHQLCSHYRDVYY